MLVLLSVFCASAGLLIFLVKWHLERHFSQFKRLGIKGPEPHSLLGNLIELRTKGQFRCMEEWTKEHGRVFGFFEGYTPVLSVSEPSLLREVMLKDSSNFLTRKHFPLAPKKSLGLFLENGAQWKRSRNLLTPAFSTGKLKMMTPVMSEAADILVEQLSDRAKSENSTDIYSMLQCLTLDVIGRCAFGLQTRAQLDSSDMFLIKIRHIFKSMTKTKIEPLLMAFPGLSRLVFGVKDLVNCVYPSPVQWLREAMCQVILARRDLGPNSNIIDLVQLMLFPDKWRFPIHNQEKLLKKQSIGLIPEHIEEMDSAEKDSNLLASNAQKLLKSRNSRRSSAGDIQTYQPRPAKNPALRRRSAGDVTIPQSLLGDITPLRDEEIMAHSMTFLLAGYETTGAALACFCHELAKQPVLQDRLLEEIMDVVGKRDISYETCHNLPLFDASFDEVLRLYPTASFITSRKASETRQYGDVTIPAGMNVLANVWALHRDPDFWEEPEIFNPDRWLGDTNAKRKSSFTYLPFGAGPRHCIGMRFATIEAKIAMVKLVQNFILEPAHDTKTDLDLISRGAIVPESEVKVRLTKRSNLARKRTTRHD